jgi:hypothetical protein
LVLIVADIIASASATVTRLTLPVPRSSGAIQVSTAQPGKLTLLDAFAAHRARANSKGSYVSRANRRRTITRRVDMKKSTMTGIAAALLAVSMSISGPASAQSLGTCGPQNQGQFKEGLNN